MRNTMRMTDADGLGTIASGALLAREIERAHADRPAVGHETDEPCANCGTERIGPYCHACGQAGHVHRNLGALVHDIAHGVFHFEGKVWHTLPLLAWRPGELTRRYVRGERAKFVSPMALFLFSVFLMFAVVSGLAGHGKSAKIAKQVDIGMEAAQARTKLADLQAKLPKVTDPEDRGDLVEKIADAKEKVATLEALQKSGITDGTTEAAGHEGSNKLSVDTGIGWLDSTVNHAAKNPELLLYKMKSYGYKYSWALIPISLPFIWLLFFWRRDVGLYDHAIFSTYSLSFMSLGVVVLSALGKIGLPTAIIVLAVLIIPPWHMYRQLKGAYLLGRFGALWRTFALLFITTITSSLFLAFLIYMGTE
ncbi:DUF3667 domain-containing protein [Sphingomonas sp. MMS24-J13]|uniref:DUF3667 domain-containing protein n=1 Tax=Sphingomonas sp. MMS24-J13 TaxID=3238686 RepID=UPI00385072AD